jgi:hypothetical protein
LPGCLVRLAWSCGDFPSRRVDALGLDQTAGGPELDFPDDVEPSRHCFCVASLSQFAEMRFNERTCASRKRHASPSLHDRARDALRHVVCPSFGRIERDDAKRTVILSGDQVADNRIPISFGRVSLNVGCGWGMVRWAMS